MKILVAGGTGFVGTAIVHALRARELEVRVLARHPERVASLESLGVELVRGDLTDAGSLTPAVEGCSHVVNLVAIIKGAPDDFERVMTRGTAALIAAAREGGVERFVQMSALGTNEQTSTMVPYYAAKWAMEREVQSVRARVRARPAELRLRARRRAADVHPAGEILAGRRRDRLRNAAHPAGLARGRRAVLRDDRRRRARAGPHVGARWPRHRDLERALPEDRRRARQATAAPPRSVLGRTHRRQADPAAAGRTVDRRPGDDDRGGRQRVLEHRCRRHVRPPPRLARRPAPARAA